MDAPEVRYARNGDVAIAYTTSGSGPVDIAYIPGYVSHVEYLWEGKASARFLRRLSSFSRLIVIDRRGAGLSDRASPQDLPPVETQMDDVAAVLDAVGSERAAFVGFEVGGMLSLLFAATFPHRVSACVTYSTAVSGVRRPGYPWQWTDELFERYFDQLRAGWGSQAYADEILAWMAPSVANDEETRRWWGRMMRLAASPGSAESLERLYTQTDIRAVLGTIRVPTLIAHRTKDPVEDIDGARYMAAEIPGARLVELPGTDQAAWGDGAGALLDEIEEFLTGVRPQVELDRVLATVLFTDIVESTRKAAEIGDAAWKELLAEHDARARDAIERYRGRFIDSTGDGLLATFDGPARAVRCAQIMAEQLRPLGLTIRAGCHTGEVELDADTVRGLAVHIGARVAAIARPSETLVSSTVKDLVAGSGLVFEDAGEHELKGVPDRWRLYRVVVE